MNAVQTKERIDFYNDLTRAARFSYAQYAIAVNDTIEEFIVKMVGDEGNNLAENFQWNQQIRDSIFNLITVVAPTVTDGAVEVNEYYSHIPSVFTFPANYRNFIALNVTSSGITSYSMPTTYNERGPLLQDSFKHPTNKRTRYIENSTGMTIWRGATGTITASLTYLRSPVAFSLGSESNTLTTGQTVVNGLFYYALETSIYNGTTYEVGDSIPGTGSPLTSGLIILTTATSPIDLPEKVHDEICKLAASKLLATIQMVEQSMVIEKEAAKPI